MKQFAIVVAAIAMTFSFTACSGDDSAKPAAVVTVTATPEPADKTDISDADFAGLVRENTDAFDAASDASIVEAAKSVCGVWRSGGTINDVINAVVSSGVDPEDGGFLAGAGTQAYCPEYANEISSSPNV